MTNTQMSARVGLFFILGIALIYITLSSLSKGKIGADDGYILIAQFTNLKELKEGDPVRMAGVKIGVVRGTRLKGRHAEAVLLLNKEVRVSKDSTATIAMAGLLGSNYLSLDLGDEKTGFLSDGDRINSLDTPDLNTLVSQLGDIGKKIDKALGGFSGALNGSDNKQGLVAKIDSLVEDNRANIGQITTNLREITTKVNEGQGTLGKLVNDTKLHDELLASVGEIKGAATQAKDFVAQAQTIIDQVRSGHGTLGVLLYDETSAENIKVVTKNIRELSDKLNKGEGTLGKLINDETLYLDAKTAVKKLDRALDGMADQAPISAVGAAAGALF